MRSSPSVPPERAFLTRQPFAHRGLHGAGVAENSRAAFAAACAAGHGIECDVQMSGDGVAFVFHDDMLDRLTAESGPFAARDAAALEGIRLSGSDETIPRLSAILALVAGRAPMLIEIKGRHDRIDALCRAVAEDLAGYTGEAAIMSFDPKVVRWFAVHAPERVRGLVVTEEDRGAVRGPIERRLSMILARPDFVACDIRDLPSAFARRVGQAGLPLLTWTVRGEVQRMVAAAHADQIIYEVPGA